MQRELCEELLDLVLMTDDLRLLGMGKRRSDELIDDELWQRVGHTDAQPLSQAAAPAPQGIGEFAPQGENLVGVIVDGAPRLGQRKLAALLAQELRADRILENGKLAADRRLGEPQFLAGARHAAFAHNVPEVEKMLIVQPFHGKSIVNYDILDLYILFFNEIFIG